MDRQSTDVSVRAECAFALCALGDPRGKDRCVTMLDDPKCSVERFARAGISLARAGDRSAIPRLLASLENGKDPRRWGAAKALAHLHEPSAIQPLCRRILEADYFRTGESVGYLEEILRWVGASARTEDLEAVLLLPESITATHSTFDLDDPEVTWSGAKKHELGPLRERAKAALDGRGP
jgi:HEAT repeat protein